MLSLNVRSRNVCMSAGPFLGILNCRHHTQTIFSTVSLLKQNCSQGQYTHGAVVYRYRLTCFNSSVCVCRLMQRAYLYLHTMQWWMTFSAHRVALLFLNCRETTMYMVLPLNEVRIHPIFTNYDLSDNLFRWHSLHRILLLSLTELLRWHFT